MPPIIEIKKFVAVLIGLVNENKILCRQCFGNEHFFNFNKFEMHVDWPQDDKPYLVVNGAWIKGYDYGIEDLVTAFRRQHDHLDAAKNVSNPIRHSEKENWNLLSRQMVDFFNDDEIGRRIL